jgi:hypothetical protein
MFAVPDDGGRESTKDDYPPVASSARRGSEATVIHDLIAEGFIDDIVECRVPPCTSVRPQGVRRVKEDSSATIRCVPLGEQPTQSGACVCCGGSAVAAPGDTGEAVLSYFAKPY